MNDMIAEAAMAALSDRKLTLATAESCTGGLVAKRITDISGALKRRKGISGVEPLVDNPRVIYAWLSPMVDRPLTLR